MLTEHFRRQYPWPEVPEGTPRYVADIDGGGRFLVDRLLIRHPQPTLLEIGAFKLWLDVREFEKVSVDPETATVTWEGGIRLDPDILYQDIAGRGARQE